MFLRPVYMKNLSDLAVNYEVFYRQQKFVTVGIVLFLEQRELSVYKCCGLLWRQRDCTYQIFIKLRLLDSGGKLLVLFYDLIIYMSWLTIASFGLSERYRCKRLSETYEDQQEV